MIKILTKTDICIITLILLSSILFFFYSNNNQQTEIIINHNNEIYTQILLTEDKNIYIDTQAIIEIKEEKVRILKSSCKNQLCVIQGWSSKQPIICVPNKIMIEFVGEKEAKDRLFITH